MPQNYASYIDHTLLKADATQSQIEKLCEEALTFKFASVCVNPSYVKLCAEKLVNSEVKVCTVIGFPLGATTSQVKAFETKDAIQNGATEIDMVINIGALKNKQYDVVLNDIKEVVTAANGTLVKVIIETCLLTDEEKVKACELSVEAGADFVKTSTGFSTGGATAEDVALMRKTVGPSIGVKASGGVRNLEDMKKMIESGATRIGASSGVAIMNGLSSDSNY
ncbi:MAG TPA: deoxyribose-phosphate aldolase [Ureibacillus sp.]|nr:deoxyribose-phosphate aldolase [Ureibacillus sp.]